MLQYLRIQNLALLDEVTLELDSGFIAVTGETGAGKSVLLGALQLLSGARGDKDLIRQGAEACELEAALWMPETSRVHAILEDLDLPACEDGALLLKRVLPRSRMPRILINGTLTTLTNLQRVGGCWIDFHGPGEPQRLFRTEAQLELLDLYAGHGNLLASYRDHYRTWKTLLAEKESLGNETALSDDEIDFLRREIRRIDECGVSEEAIDELESAYRKVSGSEELIGLARQLSGGLNGEEGVLDRLADLQRAGKDLEQADPATEPLVSRLRSLAIEAEDLGREFDSLAEGFVIDPAEAEGITARMNEWLDLKRRYGNSAEAVLARRGEMAGRLDRQGDVEGALEGLETKIAAEAKTLAAVAKELHEKRRKAAENLGKKVRKSLPKLGFRKSGFGIEIVEESVPRPNGGSRCDFRFSPNAGQELMPLNKIASSGEIARVMLALKTLLAEVDDIPVLVFDEVDANVGGEIGRAVGERLAALSGGRQVFCVTHLPQVAALAGRHYVVDKEEKGGATCVAIWPIHQEVPARIGELARMLGDRNAASARAHAEELLSVPEPRAAK